MSDKKILRRVERGESHQDAPDFVFWCPGCKTGHGVWTTRANGITGATWTFNGNEEKPTFTPSLLISTSRFTEKGKKEYEAWSDAGHPKLPEGHKFDSEPIVCHSVVTDGVLNFCGDCTHEFAGKSVPMEEF